MGTVCSHSKVQTFNKSIQMPPIKSSPSPVFTPVPRPKTSNRKDDNVFDLEMNVEDYASVWDHDIKLSSTFQKVLKSNSKPFEHHQKEILNTKSDKKHSTIYETTRIESIIDSQTQGSIHCSTSEQINELIRNLTRIHTELDQTIKLRTEQISNETESILTHILTETQDKQRRLLIYAKEQQLKYDEIYRHLLDDYIIQLDENKARDYSQLQSQLETYRQQILEESQLKILTVNDQANLNKTKVLQYEQKQASEKIDLVTSQIERLTRDEKSQSLSTELTTKTNILTDAKIGISNPPTKSRKSKA